MHSFLRSLAFIGLLLTAVWQLTKKQYDGIFYAGLALLVIGITYNMVDDWRKGRRTVVLVQLAFLLLAGIFIYARFG